MNAITGLSQLPVVVHAQAEVADVVRLSEECFTLAGDSLSAALGHLADTGAALARLHALLDPAASARLLAGVAQAEAIAADIAAGADAVLSASAHQRRSVRAVRVEVEELDRVVRTISNVSVNARIQAGALSPPRPQVAAFIQRLAAMSEEAETVLSEVREASAAIEAEMQGIDAQTKDLRDALVLDLMPALARFAHLGRTLHDRQGHMSAATDDMAHRTRGISDGVARLVVALQSGDSTRQRLERVEAVLQAAPDAAPVAESALLLLARSLFDAAHRTASAEGSAACDAARTIKETATEAMRRAATTYPPLLSGGQAQDLDRKLQDFAARLDPLAQGSAQVSERLATILRSEARLRQVSHQVRLSGLNAVLVCAKLGHDGRALRELAQWLRALTDESDAITARLQAALESARSDLALTGAGRITTIGDRLEAFRACAAELQDQAQGLETCRAETVALCLAVSDHLDRLLGVALTSLRRFGGGMDRLAGPLLLLSLRQARLPAPDPGDAATAALLDGIRQGYTMQAERDLHDALFSHAPEGQPASPQPQPDATGDDLDDIFF